MQEQLRDVNSMGSFFTLLVESVELWEEFRRRRNLGRDYRVVQQGLLDASIQHEFVSFASLSMLPCQTL